jgi:hypothetical protein
MAFAVEQTLHARRAPKFLPTLPTTSNAQRAVRPQSITSLPPLW